MTLWLNSAGISLREHDDLSKSFLISTSIIGSIIVIVYLVKLILSLYQGFRLYVLSQSCNRDHDSLKYGKWVVISGATDGIGLAMAKEFARRGHSILIIGRNSEKISKTRAMLELVPNVGSVETCRIDLSDSSLDNYKPLREQLDGENRDIGILVNNAGILETLFEEYTSSELEVIRNTVNVNAIATLYLTRIILPGMVKRRRGLILNVSSMAGSITFPFLGAYGMTKAAINYFSRILKMEYAPYGIDVINLTPGGVCTNITGNLSYNTKPSILIPSSDDFAKSALDACSTKIDSFTGYWSHEILMKLLSFLDHFGLVSFSIKYSIKILDIFGYRNKRI